MGSAAETITRRPITRRESEVLMWIRTFIAAHGYSPSMREIAEGVGLASSSTIYHHLAQLQQKGWLVWNAGQSRTVRLVDELVPA